MKAFTIRYNLNIILFLLINYPIKAQNITLTEINSYNITPTSDYQTGAFCRIFYHEDKNKFYVSFTGLRDSANTPNPNSQDFVWREYDWGMNYTGNTGRLENFKSASDYAMGYLDKNFYHLTNGSNQNGYTTYRVSRFNDSFTLIDSTIFVLGYANETNNDQLLNIIDNKLYFASGADTVQTPNAPLYAHLFVYDSNLVELDNRYLWTQNHLPTGGSIIKQNNSFYVISAEVFTPSVLYAFQYDTNWNYIGKTLLASDGQWSQGVVYYKNHFIVAYHTGSHGEGNVAVGIYDSSWNAVSTHAVTNYVFSDGLNAQRPWLLLVDSLLYLSYDLESYDTITKAEHFDWQSIIKQYKISIGASTEINKILSPAIDHFKIAPNPISKSSFVEYKLNSKSKVSIRMYDLEGKEVNTIMEDHNQEQGVYKYPFSLSHLNKGYYIVRIDVNSICYAERVLYLPYD